MNYDYHDITTALKNSGINEGDTVFFTTSLGMVGIPPDEYNDSNKVNKLFHKAIKDVLGEKGTILIPTYSYTFGENSITSPTIFDPKNTPSEIGPFTNYFLKQKNTSRSLDPMMSITGSGPRVKEFLDDLPPTSYGENSTFCRLAHSDAKCSSIGLGPNWIPFIHYVDWLYDVPHRFDKFFHGFISINDTKHPLSWIYNVRILSEESRADAHKIGRLAEEEGIWSSDSLGRARVYTARCNELFNFICENMETNKWLLATGPKSNPAKLERNRVKPATPAVTLEEFNPKSWIKELSTYRRDINSESVDSIFDEISDHFPLDVQNYKPGTHSQGWIVPERWTCHQAKIKDESGNTIFNGDDYENLARSYSNSINKTVTLKTLLEHINLAPNLPQYNYRDWGFNLSNQDLKKLDHDTYKVNIKSDFYYGNMKTGELFLEGENNKSIIIVSYIDGPGKKNQNLTGFIGAMLLFKKLDKTRNRFNFRFLVVPGKVGFSSWLEHHYSDEKNISGIIHLKQLGDSKPPNLVFNDQDNIIFKRSNELLDEVQLQNDPSVFKNIHGYDNPLRRPVGIISNQFVFSRGRISSGLTKGDFCSSGTSADLDNLLANTSESIDILEEIANIL